MIPQRKTINIYKELSEQYNVPIPVIELICNHPFKFANKVIGDPTDNKTIMFSYLFKLKKKNRYANE